MKVILYGDSSQESEAIRIFLKRNEIVFEEIALNSISAAHAKRLARLRKLTSALSQEKRPVLEIKRSHGIGIVVGFYPEAIAANLALKDWK